MFDGYCLSLKCPVLLDQYKPLLKGKKDSRHLGRGSRLSPQPSPRLSPNLSPNLNPRLNLSPNLNLNLNLYLVKK